MLAKADAISGCAYEAPFLQILVWYYLQHPRRQLNMLVDVDVTDSMKADRGWTPGLAIFTDVHWYTGSGKLDDSAVAGNCGTWQCIAAKQRCESRIVKEQRTD